MMGGGCQYEHHCWEFNNGRKLNNKLSIVLLMLVMLHPKLLLPTLSISSEGLALLRFKDRVVSDPFNALSDWTYQHEDVLTHHCSWSGVRCSHGKVILLNLKDLSLAGTLAPELGNLPHLKSLILRNNSFTGIIPSEIGDLKELEELDLGHNNFSGPVPSNLGNNFSLFILLLDNNRFLDSLSPELNQLQLLSEHQVDENQLRGASFEASCNRRSLSWCNSHLKDFIRRRLLQARRVGRPSTSNLNRDLNKVVTFIPPVHSVARPPKHSPRLSPSESPSHSPSPSPSPSRSSRSLGSPSPSPTQASAPSPSPLSSPSPSPLTRPLPPAPAPVVVSRPPANPPAASAIPPATAQAARIPMTPSPSTETLKAHKGSRSKHHKAIIWSSIAGASAFLIMAAAVVVICQRCKVVTVKPWATGLSGQLQRAFVTGLPKLKRSELEVACEDFSNIIGSLNDGTVYKGTLSSGVEIAVVSSTVKSRKDWSRNLEAQFRKKIETLSKVNHKNFVNLIGYCEEEKPFTRMMVFEYAPNGTLFEHLHIKEAERLDWGMRLRIVMGMAYCLEHMHQLDPPIPHRDLQPSSIYLSDDYAVKISDFSFWNEGMGAKLRSPSMQLLEAAMTDVESNVFSFGVVLFEMITGRMPYLEDNCTLADWVLDCMEKDHIPQELMDPTLSSFPEEEIQRLFYVIRDCMHPDPEDRPTMREVAARLRLITGMRPDEAIPKLSPLWWAELEVLSVEGN